MSSEMIVVPIEHIHVIPAEYAWNNNLRQLVLNAFLNISENIRREIIVFSSTKNAT